MTLDPFGLIFLIPCLIGVISLAILGVLRYKNGESFWFISLILIPVLIAVMAWLYVGFKP